MSVRYLLDTNIISEPLRPYPNEGVLEKLREHQFEIAIAAVVWHELHFGAQRLAPSQKQATIIRYLNEVIKLTMPILPYHERAAAWHADQRATLTTQGITPSFVDGQIAAIAQTHHLILVTNNVTDFTGFQDLTVENWFN